MIILITVLVLIVLPFIFIIFFGAPFVPSFNREIKEVYNYLDVDRNKLVFDLGSGDGRTLILAALRGADAIGYELNPLLWLISWVRTRALNNKIKIHYKNYLSADISKADIVFIFTSSIHKLKLEKKLKTELSKDSFVVSNSFKFNSLKYVDSVGSMNIYRK